ncbi:MAG: host specificity factor TipJ family phage tail protein, partial [Methanoregulaceae archaeon]|nr:host specificity factor TipJ family phage tail protein [Methanoregulaceae archaeon]
MQVPHGLTIRQIVEQADASAWTDTYIVEVDGVPVPRSQWSLIPDEKSHVLIYAPLHGGGGGGKNPLRTVLTIAVIVAATYVSGGALAPYFGASFAAGTMGASLAAAATLTAGMLLVNAVAPVKLTGTVSANQNYEDSPTYSIGSNSNQENPWGVVPVVLGTHKVYPPLGAKSYTELVGADEYLRMLVVWGYGPLDISSIKLGDTLLSSYSNCEIETNEGWSTDTPLTLFPSSVQQDSIGVILTSAGGQVTRTAQANVDELSVDISFPRGLVQYNNEGTRTAQSVTVLVQYREVGGGAWTDVETKTFTDLTTSAVRYGWRWTVDNTKQYEIGMTRTTADTDDDKIIDEVYWTYLRSIETTYPISFPHNLAVSAIRIKATDQLSGQIDNLNGVVSSYCPVWDSVEEEWGSAEGDYEITNNPAALIRWVLMGDANARARTSAQIDNDTLGEFYEFCDTNGYAFNMYRDYTASVFETCQDIAAAARGSVTIKDGLWSVTADTGEQTLVQHITPRNSWGFSAEKTLYNRPHAFRIKFKNENNGWDDDERIVYDDGYTSANATLFESIEFPGITDPDLIWKFGRFHIAQARLRPEVYTLNMDFEHLVCRRGDKVRVSHDIPLWGSGWGRVKSLTTDGGNITHITLDETVTMEAGKTYACRFRVVDGSTLVLSIVLSVGSTATLELQTPVAEASGPEVGDLAMFGEADRETVELLVHSIQRAGDFTAQLSLVDVATAVYDADTGEIPAFDPQTTAPVDITTLAPDPPTIDDTEPGTDVSTTSGGGSVSSLIVYLSAPDNDVRIRGYRLRYRIAGESQWQYTPEMDSLTITIPSVIEGVEYEIQAQSISVYGVPSTWTAVGTGTPATPQIVPSHPTGISAELVAGGEAYNYCAVAVTFTPPTDPVFSHCDIYASNDDTTYHYVGRNSAGSFTFSGLGSVYEADDTCYIKLRSVSIYELSEDMPATADDSVSITGYIRLAGFYAGSTF